VFVQQFDSLIDSMSAIITNLIGVTSSFPTINLYQNNYNPTPQSAVGDFTVADYTGYAAVLLTSWQTPSWQSQGAAVSYANPCVFSPTGTTVPNTIYGYYMTISSGLILLGAERLATPANLTGPTTSLTVVPPWGISDAGIAGVIY
jgi:hypothetical protein